MKSRPPILALCLILLLSGGITDSGCTYRTSGTPSSEAYDSAGVRVVLSHSPVWGTESAWTISDTPILEIGLKEGENPYLLNRVMGATVTSQGTIVVANGGDCSIRAFGPDGKVVWVSGACGEGPEEFQRILGLFGAGGQIYVRQYPQASLRILDTHGTFIGTAFQNLPAEFRSSDPLGTFEDGSVLLGDKIRPNVDQGPFQVSYTVGRLRSDGEIDTLTTLPFLNSVRHQSGFRGAERPMKILSLAIHRDRIYYSWPDRYEINILGPDGKLETVIRRDWKPTAVSEEYVQRARERTMRGEGGVGGPPGFLREIVDEMVFSEFHPAHHGFHVDHSGNLWVLGADPRRWDYGRIPPRIFDESSSWDIFDPEGVWLGTVQTPPRFVLYEVGEDYLLGLWRDELEVEYVRRYELVRE